MPVETNRAMDKRIVELVYTTTLIILSIVILSNNGLVEGGVETELNSMLLPRIVAVLIIIFSMTIALSSLLKILKNTKKTSSDILDVNGLMGVFYYILILVAYWFVLPKIGFLISTPITIFLICALLGARSWIVMLALSITLTTVVFFGSNYLLRVFLPTWSIS